MVKKLFFLIALFWGAHAFAQNPKAVKCFEKAGAELDKGHEDKALQLLNKAIKIDPKYSDPWSLKALIYENRKDSANACKAYKKAIQAEPLFQGTYFFYAKYLYELERYEEALVQLAKFSEAPNQPGFNPKKDAAGSTIVKQAAKLVESCKLSIKESSVQLSLNIQNMGWGINTKDWEYWPGMTIDGKYFIFTRLINGQEDFYESMRVDTGWSKAIFLPGKINTPENEGTTSITPDGRFIFFTMCNNPDGFGSCDLFYSYYSAANNTWSKHMNLGKTINSAAWDAQPAIGADGKTLIFASAREGGYGGKDLWVSHFVNGGWTTPQNLGPKINTADDDEAPFLHYDGRTLYFSSNGHPGYGMHDIFLSRLDSLGNWSDPVNLGKGINTESDEMGLYVEYSGAKGYFSSGRSGGHGGIDIYSFDVPLDKRPGPISYVLGKVKDAETLQEIAGRIEVTDLKTNRLVLKDSGYNFFTTLEPGGNYGLNVYRRGYLFYSANFQPEAAKIDSPYLVTAVLQPIKNEQKVVLNNIFFDVDKYDLKSESFAELEIVLNLLRSNPAMKIAIEGHTDNSGTEEHNQVLSENRAKSVQQYLIAKGIDKSRISYKGFGATQPVADNATPQGKAKNRRIEMRVTGI